MQPAVWSVIPPDSPVSILTRPGGRVQPGNQGRTQVRECFNPHPSRRTGATMPFAELSGAMRVSILTRPGGRVQPLPASFSSSAGFQSSPVPEDGCNGRRNCSAATADWFQSSPVPEDGCNTAAASASEERNGFNPHPSRRTGATMRPRCWYLIRRRWFQSSPVPEDGCNAGALPSIWSDWQVSILTRPGGRVQLPVRKGIAAVRAVSILTRPGGRVQQESWFRVHTSILVSILTRPGGRVQRYPSGRKREAETFQSSPVPEDGCNSGE